MSMKKNKIAGAVYGFAIGDAMGATTEFMSREEIKREYGVLDDIIGGGWLRLKAGQVTDDTQMMICVMEALQSSAELGGSEGYFYEIVGANFAQWLNMGPKDVGNQCNKGIRFYMENGKQKDMPPQALGNGGLMRALPCALIDNVYLNLIQNNFTHKNKICMNAIETYHQIIQMALKQGSKFHTVGNEQHMEPTGCVTNTLHNARYWNVVSDNFKDAVIQAVNDGGDADTIGALTGGIAGAVYGYDNIPVNWIEKLNPEVKKYLDKFINFCVQMK